MNEEQKSTSISTAFEGNGDNGWKDCEIWDLPSLPLPPLFPLTMPLIPSVTSIIVPFHPNNNRETSPQGWIGWVWSCTIDIISILTKYYEKRCKKMGKAHVFLLRKSLEDREMHFLARGTSTPIPSLNSFIVTWFMPILPLLTPVIVQFDAFSGLINYRPIMFLV